MAYSEGRKIYEDKWGGLMFKSDCVFSRRTYPSVKLATSTTVIKAGLVALLNLRQNKIFHASIMQYFTSMLKNYTVIGIIAKDVEVQDREAHYTLMTSGTVNWMAVIDYVVGLDHFAREDYEDEEERLEDIKATLAIIKANFANYPQFKFVCDEF